MTLARINLESFEPQDDREPSLSPDYKRGLEAGRAETLVSVKAQRQKALTEISATLDDMAFGHAEARAHLLDQIRPLLAQIAEVVLPDIAKNCFLAHLTETLFQAFEDCTDHQVMVSVASESVDDLALDNGRFAFTADPDLTPGQAILKRANTQIMIDTPALLTALQTALAGLEPSQRTLSNG